MASQMDIQYSNIKHPSDGLTNGYIRYSYIKHPSDALTAGYSQIDIQYSNIKRPSEDGYSIFENQTSIGQSPRWILNI